MLAMLLIIFLVLMIVGAPIAVALGLSTIIPSMAFHQLSLSSIIKSSTGAFASYLLVACPLFTFSGDIMAKGGISKRLVNVAKLVFGNVTGGIGMVSIVAAMIFSAISGTGSATVSAIGMMMIPEMVAAGYDRAYGTSMIAAAGTIGTMIPPSVCQVVYAVTAGVSLTSMFTAGIPSGIMVGLFLIGYCYISSKQRGYRPARKIHVNGKEALHTVLDAIPAFLVPLIILGGIYGGFVTPTESAALGCIVGIIVSLFVYKEVTVKDLPYFACHSMLVAAPVMFIIGMSTGFGSFLSMAKVPTMVATWILGITSNKYVLLMIINVIYLIMGTFMETNACIILMTPILLPVVKAVGVSPVHFGLISIVNLAIGFVTPPLGANLFMASAIGRVDINVLAKTIWPWIVAMIAALLLITYIPAITIGIPQLLGMQV